MNWSCTMVGNVVSMWSANHILTMWKILPTTYTLAMLLITKDMILKLWELLTVMMNNKYWNVLCYLLVVTHTLVIPSFWVFSSLAWAKGIFCSSEISLESVFAYIFLFSFVIYLFIYLFIKGARPLPKNTDYCWNFCCNLYCFYLCTPTGLEEFF